MVQCPLTITGAVTGGGTTFGETGMLKKVMLSVSVIEMEHTLVTLSS